jgi:two-component system CheB/CheR fusion protein
MSTPKSSNVAEATDQPDAEEDRRAEPVDSEQPPRLPFPVVGMGASAGGLEAFSEFFRVMRPDSGMAFVLIQHLPPERDSMMVDILSKRTTMTVQQVEDGMAVEPDHVYVIRPGRTLTIKDGRLRLGEPLEQPVHRRPVDDFFRSLAAEQRERAICISMSGMGSNGAAGARSVKAVGGVCIAQDPESAKFPSMPRSLIESGVADFVLRPQDMPDVLLRYAGHPYASGRRGAEAVLRREGQQFNEVLTILRARTRHDFSGYKKPTVLRRIQRRMGLNQVTKLADYARMMRQSSTEVTALADDLMIHVTGFFRDPEAWESLRVRVIEPLVAERDPEASIRCWVTACSTGEEAYTLAILLTEAAEAAAKRLDIKIFATDTAERTVSEARAGVYPGGIETDVSAQRLERFFDRDDSVYRVKQELRELVVFAPQNLLHDPPFSRLDICTCRNLMIYLEPAIQRRVLALLHFGLRENGALFLGTSETVSGTETLFEPVDKRWRIYRRVGPTRHEALDFPIPASLGGPSDRERGEGRLVARASVSAITNKVLLEHHTPAAVTVDRQQRIVYFHGNTDPFLSHPRGEPTRDLLVVARDGVRAALRAALHKAIVENTQVSVRDGIIETDQGRQRVGITAVPLDPKRSPGYYLVCFEVHPELAPLPTTDPGAAPVDHRRLEEELQRARDELQSSVEELQSSNEELKASNEEVTSVNEELQSTNEELETSKEEMQSLNEELTTVNNQLQAKMEELEGTTNDLSSLLSSTDIAVIFLDASFRIRRFTPAVRDLMELIPSDTGRPLSDLALKFADAELLPDARVVLGKLVPVEREIASESGRWYLRRVLPYRTPENHIEGVVITFVDITARKHAEDGLRSGQERLRRVVHSDTVGIAFFDATGRISDSNETFLRMVGYTRAELESGQVRWDRLTPPEWMARTLEAMEAFKAEGRFAPFEQQYFRKDGSRWWGLFTGSKIAEGAEGVFYVIDVSQSKQAETERAQLLKSEQEARRETEAALRMRDEFFATISHELRTPLSAILIWAKMLREKALAAERIDTHPLREGLDAIESSAAAQKQLVDDLLDTARITSGKMRLEARDTDLAPLIREAIDSIAPTAEAKGVTLKVIFGSEPVVASVDPHRLRQVIWNLLNNAVKFTQSGGRVSVGLSRREQDIAIEVTDTGRGIAPDFLPHIFTPFRQAQPTGTQAYDGLGLGLAISRQLIELHGGSIQARSDGVGRGATFTVLLPVPLPRKARKRGKDPAAPGG